jgi:Predicted nucleic acid-binding protein, contains PIN domain
VAKPVPIILDSWAVMAYLEDEPAGETVANIIADATEQRGRLMISVVNAGEIWYIVARRTNAAEADKTIRMLEEFGVEFVNADWHLTKTAARFKVNGNISYADCYAAALALERKGRLVTGDREFEQLSNQVNIHWLE